MHAESLIYVQRSRTFDVSGATYIYLDPGTYGAVSRDHIKRDFSQVSYTPREIERFRGGGIKDDM